MPVKAKSNSSNNRIDAIAGGQRASLGSPNIRLSPECIAHSGGACTPFSYSFQEIPLQIHPQVCLLEGSKINQQSRLSITSNNL